MVLSSWFAKRVARSFYDSWSSSGVEMEIPYTVYGFAMRIARLFFNRNKGVGNDFGLDGIQKKGFIVHSS